MSKKEYIEKEAAIRNICKGCGLFDTDNCICTGKVRCDEYDAILDTPPANVKPVVRGKWISVPHKRARICSHCECDEPYKFAENDADVYNFCPNCGADMRGKE